MNSEKQQSQHDTPQALVNDPDLSHSEKLAGLKRWKQDLEQLSRAASEGMSRDNSEVAEKLQAVTDCLNEFQKDNSSRN